MATELTLIRHGNAIPIRGDYLHAPLTALGCRQAEMTGHFMATEPPLDGFYCSPLHRAHETADIIGQQINRTPTVREGIQEVERGEVALLAVAELFAVLKPVERYLYQSAGQPMRWPIQGRVSRTMSVIINAHPDQRAAVVVHAGVISSVLAWMFPGQRFKWWRTTVDNCSLTRLLITDGKCTLVGANMISHLTPIETTAQAPAPAVEATRAVMEAIKPIAEDKPAP